MKRFHQRLMKNVQRIKFMKGTRMSDFVNSLRYLKPSISNITKYFKTPSCFIGKYAAKQKNCIIQTQTLPLFSSLLDQRSVKKVIQSFKRQPHKLVKHTQTICRLLPTNCLSVFDHFVGLPLKGLNDD